MAIVVWGHNETDEPTFTQPVLYRTIAERPNVREGYLEHLLELKNVSREEADKILTERHAKLEQQLEIARAGQCEVIPERHNVWSDYVGGREPDGEPDTGVETKQLSALLEKLTELPAGFQLHPKLERMLAARREMAGGKIPPRLGSRRGARARDLDDGGNPDSPDRAGHRTRHVQSSSCDSSRSNGRAYVHAAATSCAGTGARGYF